ncbi:MAG: PD40 domain-containing protein [Gammaproteobacteria bacterium]|nr:PD40 domain-containing protein [Gammaproteobacteria bacterium]
MNKRFRVGGWVVDYSGNHLSKDGQSIRVEPLAMDTLLYFAQHQGEVISRDELIDKVWGGKIVGDHAIYRIINLLRKTLEQGSSEPIFATVRKKGYQLVAPVEFLNTEPAISNDELVTPIIQKHVEAKLVSHKDSATESIEAASLESSSVSDSISETPKTFSINFYLIASILLSIALISTYFYWSKDSQPMSELTKVRPFTNLLGEEKHPVYSKDGEWLAFSHRPAASQYWHIYVKAVDPVSDSSVIKLTDGEYIDEAPAWSPDGNQIAFFRHQPGKCTIMTIKFDRKTIDSPKEITDCGGPAQLNDLAWSASGDELIFSSSRSDIEPSKIYQFSLVSGRLTQLTNSATIKGKGDLKLALSPDGTKLAYLRDVDWGNSELHLLDLESFESELLIENLERLKSVTWSKDSSKIIYVSDYNQLMAYSLRDGTHQTIARNVQRIHSPNSSPVKDEVAIVVGQSAIDIWQQNIQETESGDKWELLDAPNSFISSSAIDYFPVYANNSNKAAFVSLRSGDIQVWIREEQGKEYPVTNFKDGRSINRLRWSPDDRYLLSESNNQIFTIDTKLKNAEILFSDDEWPTVEVPSWSADGKSIYFSSDKDGEWQIFRLSVSSGNVVEQITSLGGYSAQESENGEFLYYLKYHKPGLWKYSLTEKTEELLQEDIDVYSHNGWYVRGDNIFYVTNNVEAPGLYVKAKGASVERLMPLNPFIRAFGLSPNNDRVIYPKMFESESSILLLSP